MARERGSRQEVMEKVLRVKALIDGGETLQIATKRIGLAENTYRRWAKRNFRFPGVNIDSGSVSAASLPPRPKGGKRPPKPLDMNSVESLAKRMSKIDKLLQGVGDLKTERKKIAGRLRSLLKV
jgi:hypothetical protein